MTMVAILILLIDAAPSAVPSEIDSVITAQQSSLSLIYSVDMEIDSFQEVDGEPLKSPRHNWRFRWSKEGDKDRQRYEGIYGFIDNSKSSFMRFGDQMDDGKSIRQIKNLDPKDSTPLALSKPTKAVGYVMPQGTNGGGFFPYPLASFFLQAVRCQTDDVEWSLPSLRAASPRVSFVGSVTEGGRKLTNIVIDHPNKKGRGGEPCSVSLFFDPQVGWLIRKQVIQLPKGMMSEYPAILEMEVIRFKTMGGGVFVPEETLTTVRVPEFSPSPIQVFRAYGRKMRINTPLPADAFDFRFPENLQVRDYTSYVDNEPSHYLWGKDDKPGKMIESQVDLQPPPDESDPNQVRRATFYVLGVSLVCVLAGAIVYRRMRRQRR